VIDANFAEAARLRLVELERMPPRVRRRQSHTLESMDTAAPRYTNPDTGFTCYVPARATTRAKVSKRRIACAACNRRLADDLMFEYVSETGKRQVYCDREDCSAL